MWRVFFPLRYFALINSEKKHIDLWPTLALATMLALPFLCLPGVSFFRSGGFLDKIMILTGALTGFYVAALVAAATFTLDDLDKVIALGSIELPLRVEGKKVRVALTRREFACTIFGYLAFSAMMISVFAALFVTISIANHSALQNVPLAGRLFSGAWFQYVRGTFVVLFSLAISHLVVTTSLGLYYLMDRLYRKDPKIITEKHGKRAA
jgi:hypothetical protein